MRLETPKAKTALVLLFALYCLPSSFFSQSLARPGIEAAPVKAVARVVARKAAATGCTNTSVAHCVDLSWTASTSAATYPSTGSYTVLRANSSGQEAAYANSIGATLTAWEDDDVTAGLTYFYTMEFCVVSGTTTQCSGPSNEVSASVPLAGGDLEPPSTVSAKAH